MMTGLSPGSDTASVFAEDSLESRMQRSDLKKLLELNHSSLHNAPVLACYLKADLRLYIALAAARSG